VYAFIGGVGVVLFWRGVWHLADDISMASAVSLFLGTFILLITGIFVSEFVGKRLIITGLIGEKKLEEKEVGEIQTEEMQIKNLQTTLTRLENKLDHIDGEIENRH
jgi:peptidoglycan hydrolase CwlO-like protein